MAEGFVSDFKRFFLRGLVAVLPMILTVGIILYAFDLINTHISSHINNGVFWLLVKIWGKAGADGVRVLPEGFLEIWHKYFQWMGFAIAILGIYIFGRILASYLGRGVWLMAERVLYRMPVVGNVLTYVKQVVDVLFGEKKIEFSRVVAVEYPRKGVWSVGLVTGAGMRTLQNASAADLLTVFIPSSPMPVTGYTITVRRDEAVDLPMSIDDALRYTVSGGVIVPPPQRLSDMEIEQARQGVYPMLQQKENAE
ncbi:MAG: DUF502 domain-containing protein [Planctomycetes bacterium]|nr:DUF502 domain-containing protein [Planctomycetota bacterium]